jgi:hypothetical protein
MIATNASFVVNHMLMYMHAISPSLTGNDTLVIEAVEGTDTGEKGEILRCKHRHSPLSLSLQTFWLR